jgi:hypothetical protein
MFANYHLPRKKDSFDLIILRSHLWGGRFQVIGTEEGENTGGEGRKL